MKVNSDLSKVKVGDWACEFKEGDRVVVWNDARKKYRAYFSHFRETDGTYYCFYPGDRWTSKAATIEWKYCEKWKEL